MNPADSIWLMTALAVVGALGAEVGVRTAGLPRVLGYSLVGAMLALTGHGVALPLSGWSRGVVDSAAAVLLFEVGAQLRLRWLASNRSMLLVCVLEASLTAGLSFAVLYWLGVGVQAAAAAAVATLPASVAVAGRVARELGAQGQVAQRMAVLAATGTLAAAILMVPLLSMIHLGQAPIAWLALSELSLSMASALALATALALAIAGVTKWMNLRQENTVLLVLALILLVSHSARLVGTSTLLVPLLAGALLRNISDRAWPWPQHFGTAGGLLVLMMFVVVGSAWSVGTLQAGWWMACALVAARLAAKTLAVLALRRPSGLKERQGLALAITLMPLSVTCLLLLNELMVAAPSVGAQIAPVVLSALAILELTGPLAVRWGLRRAGEVPVEIKRSEA
ncbi:cation:proton antiporter [Inhella gelatinilytica]|uniref:Cation:proton antiporter n=1 Tax=Inhella gelatinilytica TaxID=2795030 RepID=A0A931IX50_9BURK|nr:cation:proton antiporter [Inhella gelatinilytica]MBH9551491.1 cation:proton antiporter [Inhella gelatinilytica]